ncbi:MAG: propanediol utilization protein [Bacillus sp. (in: firmicutes)]
MKVKAICPASCGELLQGWIAGGEKLISYPIDWYSEVTLEAGRACGHHPRHRKAWRAFYQTCRHYRIPAGEIPPVSLTVRSTIPIAKGMASSTADIAATAAATAHLLGFELTGGDLARICLSLEATDSTIFPTLTLFDHLRGKAMEQSGWAPSFHVLVLEPLSMLVTEEFRRQGRQALQRKQAPLLEEAYAYYRQALAERSLRKLGEAATISAMANQEILPKPCFSAFRKLVETGEVWGVNVAHSGTVVGIMYDEEVVSGGDLLRRIEEKGITKAYPRHHFRRAVRGGVTIL